MASKFNFFKTNEVYGNLFFQFPKALLYGAIYNDLSSEAKLAYMILKDRLEYSLQNNWVDENNSVYFIFTNSELKSLFNCSEHKVIKIKDELVNKNLLLQKRIGLNKPNHLYLADLEVNANEVYLKDKKVGSALLPQGTAKSAVPEEEPSALLPQGTAKSAVPKNEGSALEPQGTAKSAVNLYKELKVLDTNRYYLDTETDFSKTDRNKMLDQDLLAHLSDLDNDQQYSMLFDQAGLKLIGMWCENPKKAHELIGIVLNAKKSVEKEYDTKLATETLQADMTTTLRRAINAIRNNQDAKKNQVRNTDNYFYGAFKSMFRDAVIREELELKDAGLGNRFDQVNEIYMQENEKKVNKKSAR